MHRALLQLAKSLPIRRKMPVKHQSSIDPGHIRHLVLDFDQTLTTKDTLAVLASASPLKNSADVFSSLTQEYLKDYNDYSKEYPARQSIQDEWSYLAGLRPIERRSIERIEASDLFKGIRRENLKTVAQDVEIRKPGEFSSLLEWISSHCSNSRVSVLSVNWSAVFIREVLNKIHEAIEDDKGGGKRLGSKVDIPNIAIRSNTLLTDSDDVTTGKLDRQFGTHGLWTAEDKVRILDEILDFGEHDTGAGGCNVYVGDSTTDLAALLHERVDFGFVMGGDGENESLLKTCQRLGVRVLKRAENTGTSENSHDGAIRPLYRVKGWAELLYCLQNQHEWR